jgi:hypothetical protein
MFRVKGASEGIKVSDKQYTAVFDVLRKIDVEITFHVGSAPFRLDVFCVTGRVNATWLVRWKIRTASHKV